MKSRQNDTAILFFSRSAKEEGLHKSLVNENRFRTNTKICKALISNSIGVLKKSGLPYFSISSDEQSGHNFGERLANALRLVFNKGYSNVIAIGNDCPLLRVEDITNASQKLETGHDVLGPAKDGGIYLLGIRKDHFDKDSFQRLNWQLSSLFDDIQQYFQARDGRAYLLNTKQDVDTEQDLLTLFDSNPESQVIQYLKEIYFKRSIFQTGLYIDSKIISRFHQSLGLRGPPKLTH